MASCHICGAADAVAVCQQCRRMICDSDKIQASGHTYCRLCKPTDAESSEPVRPAPALDLLVKKQIPVLRRRYPALEVSIRLLAVLSYVIFAVGIVYCLACLIVALISEPESRRLLIAHSAVGLFAAPVGFLALQTFSQFLRLLVDIERNTRQPRV